MEKIYLTSQILWVFIFVQSVSDTAPLWFKNHCLLYNSECTFATQEYTRLIMFERLSDGNSYFGTGPSSLFDSFYI